MRTLLTVIASVVVVGIVWGLLVVALWSTPHDVAAALAARRTGGPGWWCYRVVGANPGSGLTTCERTRDACEGLRDIAHARDGVTPCRAHAGAWCVAYEDRYGAPVADCFGKRDDCESQRNGPLAVTRGARDLSGCVAIP
jgi:hypothetical protein